MDRNRGDDELPIVPATPGIDVHTGDRRVVGVLLAAGSSSRFGHENKLLATIEGEPIVRHAARTLVDSAAHPVVVVVGHEAERVVAALTDLDVEFVENPAYADGQATSVRTGVSAASARAADAIVVCLGDMPFVRPSTVDALIAAHTAGGESALAAAYEGRRGNPVLFDSRHFDRLLEVDGDVGGRDIFLDSSSAALIETGDPGTVYDVDEKADLP